MQSIGVFCQINKNQLIHNVNLCALNGVAIRIYSPLNIEVVDQNGKRLGLDQNIVIMRRG